MSTFADTSNPVSHREPRWSPTATPPAGSVEAAGRADLNWVSTFADIPDPSTRADELQPSPRAPARPYSPEPEIRTRGAAAPSGVHDRGRLRPLHRSGTPSSPSGPRAGSTTHPRTAFPRGRTDRRPCTNRGRPNRGPELTCLSTFADTSTPPTLPPTSLTEPVTLPNRLYAVRLTWMSTFANTSHPSIVIEGPLSARRPTRPSAVWATGSTLFRHPRGRSEQGVHVRGHFEVLYLLTPPIKLRPA
jgi:hypothetical protein